MPIIKFIKEKKEIEVPVGANLRSEAVKAGVNLNQALRGVSDGIDDFICSVNRVMNCHGLGMCGTCRVLVTKGMENTNSMTLREKIKFKSPIPIPTPIPDPLPSLAFVGNEQTMRLACMTTVHGDIEVVSGPEVNLYGENFFS